MSVRTAYLAAEEFVDELADELGAVDRRHGRLMIASGAGMLRAVRRTWAVYAAYLHRRATLIQEQLPTVSSKPLVFGAPQPEAPLGSWTLLDAQTMLVSPHCTSAFPNGEVHFVEDRSGPPSRAYLKLWEALTLIGRRPGPGERCLDLRSRPRGWGWAL